MEPVVAGRNVPASVVKENSKPPSPINVGAPPTSFGTASSRYQGSDVSDPPPSKNQKPIKEKPSKPSVCAGTAIVCPSAPVAVPQAVGSAGGGQKPMLAKAEIEAARNTSSNVSLRVTFVRIEPLRGQLDRVRPFPVGSLFLFVPECKPPVCLWPPVSDRYRRSGAGGTWRDTSRACAQGTKARQRNGGGIGCAGGPRALPVILRSARRPLSRSHGRRERGHVFNSMRCFHFCVNRGFTGSESPFSLRDPQSRHSSPAHKHRQSNYSCKKDNTGRFGTIADFDRIYPYLESRVIDASRSKVPMARKQDPQRSLVNQD